MGVQKGEYSPFYQGPPTINKKGSIVLIVIVNRK
jgi:hypothetical protein